MSITTISRQLGITPEEAAKRAALPSGAANRPRRGVAAKAVDTMTSVPVCSSEKKDLLTRSILVKSAVSTAESAFSNKRMTRSNKVKFNLLIEEAAELESKIKPEVVVKKPSFLDLALKVVNKIFNYLVAAFKKLSVF